MLRDIVSPCTVQIDYQQVEEAIKADYRQATAQYRLDDEIEVTTENHRRLCGTLKSVCRKFSRPVAVLDVGCGTGRYFHCLENVQLLVGLDISDEMLSAARSPVRSQEVTARKIELVRGNAYLACFPEQQFDFIYSLGMFGHGCPVTRQMCERFYSWLKPGGVLFFNAIDFAGLPRCYRVRRRFRAVIYPLLPDPVRDRLDKREAKSPFFYMSARQLRALMHATQFQQISVSSHKCESPLWNGRHLECLAVKPS